MVSAWQVVESLHGLSLAGSGSLHGLSLAGSGVIAWSQPGR